MKHKDLSNFPNLAFLIPVIDFTGGYVAGGAFKNIFSQEKVKDIDVFFECKEKFETALAKVKEFIGGSDNYSFVYENDNCYCYRDRKLGLNIELIHKEFNTPETEIKTFDFTITKFAVYKGEVTEGTSKLETYKVVYHEDFFEHLQVKRLVIDEDFIEYPVSTFNRSFRYTSYGYNLCRESKIKLLTAIAELREIDDETLGASLYFGKD